MPKAKPSRRLPAGSGAKAAAARGAKAKAKPLAPPASPEEKAARRLQALARGFLGRRLASRKRCERRQLAEAVRCAEVAALKAEKRRAEAQRGKEEEKRRRAQKLVADTRLLLEASFEGQEQKVQQLLESLPVDAAAPSGATALSEAAAAGKGPVVQLLLQRRANPNSRGEFQRTPLWRASYSGRLELVPLLLEAGADPRLRDDDAQTPADVCCTEDLVSVFASWDLARTDELLEDFKDWLEEQRSAEQQRHLAATQGLERRYEASWKRHQAAQMMLAKAKMQMRSREKEWGAKLAAGHKDALDACASADAALREAEQAAQEARRDFEEAALARLDAMGDGVLPGRDVPVKALNDVLIKDLGGRIAGSNRWPLVVDAGEIAQKLLQYSGNALLSFFGDVAPERLRLGLLTMLRAGGILALDLQSFGAGVSLELLKMPFEELQKGLFQHLCSRQLLKATGGRPAFFDLITKEERKEKFPPQVFDEQRLASFKFLVVTSTDLPHEELMEHFDLIRVLPA